MADTGLSENAQLMHHGLTKTITKIVMVEMIIIISNNSEFHLKFSLPVSCI